MNEKEMNLAILAELKRIANEVFAKVKISKEGTYTAAELWNWKNALNEFILIDYNGTQFDESTVEVGTFKCSFTPGKVFYLIWKFEQLCHVRQENKARFTYGVEKREIITGKAMYIGKGEKVMKRKKTLVRLSEHVAYEPCKQSDSVDMYYFACGIWYYVQRAHNESQLDRMANKLENDTEWLKNTLNGMDYTQDIAINTIYKALRDVLCAEVIKDAPEERKCENEAENAVSCESLRNRPNFTKPFRNHIVMVRRLENGAYHCKQFLLNEVGNGLYRDADNLFFEFGEYCYTLGGYTRGVASFLKEQTDIKAKIVSMIEAGGISTESAKLLYEKLTGHKFGEPAKVEPTQEEAHEDYPPEPYNKTGEASCNDEAEITPERKAIRTTFSRQKAFPNELYLQKRKMRRYKPFSCLRYTNYHLWEESAVKRKRNGNTSVYRALIRGETKNNILICR